MKSGIYLIKNKINNKKYVGSTINFKKRWGQHISALNKNSHDNSYLQKSWNKYGMDNFEFSVIEEVIINDLLEREQYYINYYNVSNRNDGYNLLPTAGNNLGYKHTNETKEKMRKPHGAMSKEAKENMKISASKRDKSMYSNPERNMKISKANINKKYSEETKKKMSESRNGKKHSEETKKKMSESKKGKLISNETKKKISDALKGNKNGVGRIVSDETRKNISISHKGINRGEKNGRAMAKTNKEEVIKIRNDYNEGLSISEIMIKYKRKYKLIYNIVKNISWKWLV